MISTKWQIQDLEAAQTFCNWFPWEADSEVDLNVQELYQGVSWKGMAKSEIGQNVNLNFSVISMEVTDDPAESGEDGILLQSFSHFRIGRLMGSFGFQLVIGYRLSWK